MFSPKRLDPVPNTILRVVYPATTNSVYNIIIYTVLFLLLLLLLLVGKNERRLYAENEHR